MLRTSRLIIAKNIKKVLLHERKRYITRCVAGGYPILTWWGVPQSCPGWGGTTPRKDLGKNLRLVYPLCQKGPWTSDQGKNLGLVYPLCQKGPWTSDLGKNLGLVYPLCQKGPWTSDLGKNLELGYPPPPKGPVPNDLGKNLWLGYPQKRPGTSDLGKNLGRRYPPTWTDTYLWKQSSVMLHTWVVNINVYHPRCTTTLAQGREREGTCPDQGEGRKGNCPGWGEGKEGGYPCPGWGGERVNQSMLKRNRKAKNKQIDYCEKQILILRIIIHEQLFFWDQNCTFSSMSWWFFDGLPPNLHKVGLIFQDDQKKAKQPMFWPKLHIFINTLINL